MQWELGIVMGYYGSIWSDEDIKSYASFCQKYKFHYFLYAPKQDKALRENSTQPFSESYIKRLQQLHIHFKAHGISFGVGLTPVHVYTQKITHQFLQNIHLLQHIGIDRIGVFFDDVIPQLPPLQWASVQVNLLQTIVKHTNFAHYITVPTYYSTDHKLIRILGGVPSNYWIEWQKIPPQFQVFWTGAHIINFGYTKNDFLSAQQKLGQLPVLWDNYPVNDTPYLQDTLRLFAPTYTKPLKAYMAGHAYNPMSQPQLSKIPLSCVQAMYHPSPTNSTHNHTYNPKEIFLQQLYTLVGNYKVAYIIEQALMILQLTGIQQTDVQSIQWLLQSLHPFRHNPYAAEIIHFIHDQCKPKSSQFDNNARQDFPIF